MNQPVGDPLPISYWGRFVPLSVGLVLITPIVLAFPLLNVAGMIGVPAALLVLFQEHSESSLNRWLPAITTAVVMGMIDILGGLMTFSFVLSAILLDREVRRGREWGAAGLAGSIPFLLLAAGSLLAVIKSGELIEEQLLATYSILFEQMSQMGLDTARIVDMLPEIVSQGVRLIPAAAALTGFFVGFGALTFGMWWMGKRGIVKGMEVPQFTIWVLPEKLFWSAVFGLVLWIIGLIVGPGNLHTAGLNLVIILAAVYSVQGLAIMWYGFEVRGTATWIRVLFVIMVSIMVHVGVVIMALLGLLETWVPLRSLMAEAAEQGKEEDL